MEPSKAAEKNALNQKPRTYGRAIFYSIDLQFKRVSSQNFWLKHDTKMF